MASLLDWVRRLLGQVPPAPHVPPQPQERLVVGVNALLCICDEEWCFCTQLVPVPVKELAGLAELGVGVRLGNNACAQCRAGKHVWSAGG